MKAHLYFICPTDQLEAIINSCYKQANYYYTSLGNSLELDQRTINHLRILILKHKIEDISLVLSKNNTIICDALANRGYSKVINLVDLYSEIIGQKEYSDLVWQKNNCTFTILSHYLKYRMKKMRRYLDGLKLDNIEIHGKIYDQREGIFHQIYSDFICRDYYSLN